MIEKDGLIRSRMQIRSRNYDLHVYKPPLYVMWLLFTLSLAVSRPARALVIQVSRCDVRPTWVRYN